MSQPEKESPGINKAELRRLLTSPTPSDIEGLLEEPISLERALAWSYLFAAPADASFQSALERLEALGQVRTGRELIGAALPLDLCEQACAFRRILRELAGVEDTEMSH